MSCRHWRIYKIFLFISIKTKTWKIALSVFNRPRRLTNGTNGFMGVQKFLSPPPPGPYLGSRNNIPGAPWYPAIFKLRLTNYASRGHISSTATRVVRGESSPAVVN